MFLESGTAGVKARSVNENEPVPTSCLTCRITDVSVEGTKGRRGGEVRKWGRKRKLQREENEGDQEKGARMKEQEGWVCEQKEGMSDAKGKRQGLKEEKKGGRQVPKPWSCIHYGFPVHPTLTEDDPVSNFAL